MNTVSWQDVHSLVGGQELIQVIQELQQTVALSLHARRCARCVLVCCGIPHLRRDLADHLWEPHPRHVTKARCRPCTKRESVQHCVMHAGLRPAQACLAAPFLMHISSFSFNVRLQDGYLQAHATSTLVSIGWLSANFSPACLHLPDRTGMAAHLAGCLHCQAAAPRPEPPARTVVGRSDFRPLELDLSELQYFASTVMYSQELSALSCDQSRHICTLFKGIQCTMLDVEEMKEVKAPTLAGSYQSCGLRPQRPISQGVNPAHTSAA